MNKKYKFKFSNLDFDFFLNDEKVFEKIKIILSLISRWQRDTLSRESLLKGKAGYYSPPQ
jgi:hypothetical protein